MAPQGPERVLLALDDTDDAQGGCTTHAALELVHRLGLSLRSMPRLVRLNPNCPHKTRGNGAVVLELATPEGPRVQIGSWAGKPVEAFPDGGAPTLDAAAINEVVQALARPGAEPAFAIAPEPLPAAVYREAVSSRVDQEEAILALEASGATWAGGRGIVGCAGALAWPGPASSYELIAYRDPSRWGTERTVAQAPLASLDASATFHTHDSGHLTCVPATPCPVLMGLRGRDPERLVADALPAARQAAGEPMAGWCLWATNQASGDHVVEVEALRGPTWGTVRVPLRIDAVPEARAGGRAEVRAVDSVGRSVTLVAFEPTGAFRHHVWNLRPGDLVEATGAVDGDTIQLESLRLIEAVPEKVSNPTCCGKSMKSRGRGAGYACVACGARAEASAAQFAPRAAGAWEVPVMARRHLHRPLDW